MPKAVIKAGYADTVLPATEITDGILKQVSS